MPVTGRNQLEDHKQRTSKYKAVINLHKLIRPNAVGITQEEPSKDWTHLSIRRILLMSKWSSILCLKSYLSIDWHLPQHTVSKYLKSMKPSWQL
jgi:hypothetical protein